jgi:uncharacterized membrane protein
MRIFKTSEQELWSVFGASEMLIIAAAVWAYEALHGIHEPLILHFSSYTGINQIGTLSDLLGVAATAAVLMGVNTVLMSLLVKREGTLFRFLALSTLFIAVLIFIAFMAIISVNS